MLLVESLCRLISGLIMAWRDIDLDLAFSGLSSDWLQFLSLERGWLCFMLGLQSILVLIYSHIFIGLAIFVVVEGVTNWRSVFIDSVSCRMVLFNIDQVLVI